MKIKNVLLNISHDLEGEEFELINSGGCCFFAATLSKELEKRRIPYTLVMREPYSQGDLMDYENQANNEESGFSAAHVYLRIEGTCFDSDGFHTDEDVEGYSDDIREFKWSSEQITNYHNNGDWNDCFLEYSPENIERMIKIIIKNNFRQYDTKDSIRH